MNHPPAPSALMRRLPTLLAVPVALLLLVPLLLVAVPPLHDYPFHLARADAIAALLGQVDHATVYRLGNFALPNVAMDVVTMALTSVLPPSLAARVFLGLVLLLTVGGVAALHRVLHGRASPWPLLAAFLAINWIFLFGFTNYLFGVAAMLWSVAAWLALARAGWAVRLTVGSLLAVALLFCHLAAFGVFAVVLGGLALTDAWARRRAGWRMPLDRLLLPAVPLAVAMAVFIAISPTAGEVRQPIAWHDWIGWKPLTAWRTVLSGNPGLDAVTLGPVALLSGWLFLTRRLAVASSMLVPLGLLAVTFVVMPYSLFGSLYADARLPVAVLFLAIAAFDLHGVSPRAALAGSVALVVLLAVHSAGIARDWQLSAPVFARHQAAFSLLPPGSVLWSATARRFPSLAYRSADELALWHPPLKHVASLASVGRDVFVPSTWADPFKQPITVPPEWHAAKQLQGDNPFRTATAAALESAVAAIVELRMGATEPDYLLLSYPDALQGTPSQTLDEVARGPDFVLFRIVRR